MSGVFLDTSLWLAVLVPKEAGHETARARYERVAGSRSALVTTPLVIAETHALLLNRRGIRAGQHFLRSALGGVLRVVFVDAELIGSAVEHWVTRFRDQPFSLCDAVSFEVMRRERLTTALAFDRHFAAAGFEIVS